MIIKSKIKQNVLYLWIYKQHTHKPIWFWEKTERGKKYRKWPNGSWGKCYLILGLQRRPPSRDVLILRPCGREGGGQAAVYEKQNKTKQDPKEKWFSLYKMLCAAEVNALPHPCDVLTTKASCVLTSQLYRCAWILPIPPRGCSI